MNLTELKRLAEDCKNCGIDFDDVSPQQGSTSCDKLVRHYLAAASPDVVLGLIKSLEHTTMAAESEAKEVDERNAEIDKLRTQNQALLDALKGLQKQYAEHPDAFWDWSQARAAIKLAEGNDV